MNIQKKSIFEEVEEVVEQSDRSHECDEEQSEEQEKQAEERLNQSIAILSELKHKIYSYGKMNQNALRNLRCILDELLNWTGSEISFKPNTVMLELLDELAFVRAKDDFYLILVHAMHCNKTYSTALSVLNLMIKHKQFVPDLFKTKRFAFFISEKLLEEITALQTNKTKEEAQKIMSEKSIESCFNSETENTIGSSNSIRRLIQFATKIIQFHRPFSYTLQSVNFFSLLNLLIIKETAELYNVVFDGLDSGFVECEVVKGVSSDLYKNYADGAVFEIRRRGLEEEQLLRNKILFEFKTNEGRNRGTRDDEALFYDLQVTILVDLVEYFVEDMHPVMAYKPIGYIRNEIIGVIKEKYAEYDRIRNKNRKVSKVQIKKITDEIENWLIYYRKHLELGNRVHSTLLKSILYNINLTKQTRYNSLMIAFHHINDFESRSYINLINIRNVFNCLEYSLSVSDTLKIVEILKVIYNKESNKHYKPTYLVVLRSVLIRLEACDDESDSLISAIGWIQAYFKDFVDFIRADQVNCAEILIQPAISKKKARQKTYELDQEDELDLLQRAENLINTDNFVMSHQSVIESEIDKLPEKKETRNFLGDSDSNPQNAP